MTFVELLVAAVLTVMLGTVVALVVDPARTTVRVEQDSVDLEQRLRVAAETLTRDLRAAVHVLPYRAGSLSPDPPDSVFTDRASMMFQDPRTLEWSSRTYYFKPETHQLMVYDGRASDMPVLDHVSAVTFEYPQTEPVMRVRVTIVAEPVWTGASRPNTPREIQLDVMPRNFRSSP